MLHIFPKMIEEFTIILPNNLFIELERAELSFVICSVSCLTF